MPGETTTLTEGLRAAAGARSKTKALHRILAARWRPRPLYVLHACPADVFTAYDDLDNFYSSVSSCQPAPRIRRRMLAGVRSRCVGSGLPENSTILLSTPARAASRDRYHYASQLTSYPDKDPRTPYPIKLDLLVLRDIRLLEPVDRALDEVVVLRLQI